MSNWIKWNGGECPVEEGTLVDVEHRDGEIYESKPALGENNQDWSHTDDNGDIVAYRLCESDLQSRTNDANLQQAFDTVQRAAHYNQSGIDVYDKYNRPCKGVTIDVYDVLVAFNVTNPALQHLIKKALAVGQRGHKDKAEDLNDILASAKRAIELEPPL